MLYKELQAIGIIGYVLRLVVFAEKEYRKSSTENEGPFKDVIGRMIDF